MDLSINLTGPETYREYKIQLFYLYYYALEI